MRKTPLVFSECVVVKHSFKTMTLMSSCERSCDANTNDRVNSLLQVKNSLIRPPPPPTKLSARLNWRFPPPQRSLCESEKSGGLLRGTYSVVLNLH
ncbi:unnamed protein product [Ixodes pacificus]